MEHVENIDYIKRFGLKLLAGVAGAGVALSGRAEVAQAAGGVVSVNCPIYTCHEVSPSLTAWLLEYRVKREGREAITVSHLIDILTEVEDIPDHPICCLTYDDRLKSQYRYAVPLLLKTGTVATFYGMSEVWRGDGVHAYMNEDEMSDIEAEELFERGDHTDNHPKNLPEMRTTAPGAYLEEIDGSAQKIREHIAVVTEQPTDDLKLTFAYPYGRYTPAMFPDLAKIYKGAVTTVSGTIQRSDQLFELKRIGVS